jgi:hypothetical protein
MSIYSLNYQGAGNASTVREFRDFVTKFAPSILCILETQISKTVLNLLQVPWVFIELMLLEVMGEVVA